MTTEVLGTTPESAAKTPPPWVPDDSSLGARLALVRQRMGWGNVKEAALACGLPAESWRTWERDNVMPRDREQICRKIHARTGCNYTWLLGGHAALRGGISVTNHPRAERPRDNRPNGGPRKRAESDALRRPKRTRPPQTMVPTRRAA